MTATGTLVDHALSVRYADLPAEVRDRLKRHLLDTLGVALGGRAVAASSPAVGAAVERLAGGGNAALDLGTGRRRPAADAALANGTYAHSLDFDDTHRESSLHPGAPTVPAALAVAERDGADAERALAGIAAGYDVTCAVGRAVDPDAHYDRGFHVTATCGTFGAAAAAGVVAGLSREELAAAFGIAGSQAAGSLQFLENGAWNKRLHPGLAARRGVEAVALAAEGFRGASAPLEGTHGFLAGYSDAPRPDAVADVGERHAVMETALKPYPCCRYVHAAIDALLDLAGAVDPSAVERITLDLPGPGVTLTGDPIDRKRRPENLVDCQFSAPFCAALALTHGEAGLSAFVDASGGLADPDLRRLMDATEVVTTDAVADRFPEQWAARVVVDDGRRHERFVETARGEPEAPLDWPAIEAKLDDLAAAAGIPDGTADRLAAAVRDVEDRGLPDLFDALGDAATAAGAGAGAGEGPAAGVRVDGDGSGDGDRG
ncbi:MAG: MmgE/PrpD family protein [Haloferacaceae archaeon]